MKAFAARHGRWWRWRRWIVAALLLLAVRVALPIVLRHVIATQASQALQAKVEVGDVDLRLWRGGITLDEVAVRALDAPAPPPGAPTPAADAPPPAFTEYSPIVSFKRLAIEIRYLPLFRRTIQLRDVELESPRVAVDRLSDGDLNIMALVPKQNVALTAGGTPGGEATPTPAAVAPESAEREASGWKLGLDRFVLKDGRLRFRDQMVQGSEPVEVGIDRVSVDQISMTPEVYGEPARIHVKLGVDEGSIDVDSQLRLAGTEVTTTAEIRAEGLPLRRARLYVPRVGWSELQGELDLELTYELEPKARNQVHGTVALRDVSVKVPALQDTAMSWKRFAVDVENIDLLGQRALLKEVALDGAQLTMRARGGDLLPALAPPDAGAGAPAAAGAPPDTAAPPAEPAESAKPWEWRVAAARITDSTVHLLGDQAPIDVGVSLDATDLGGAADAVAHLALALGLARGAVKLDGDLRIAAPAFGGRLQIDDLSLPPLVATGGVLPPAALPSAVLRSDLAISAGLPAQSGGVAPADRLLVSGTLGLSDLHFAPPAGGLTADVKELDLRIDRLSLPGVIPPGKKAASGATIDLAAELALSQPHLVLEGTTPLDLEAQAVKVAVPALAVPASIAMLGPSEGPETLTGNATLELTAPRLLLGGGATSVEAQRIALGVSDASLAVLAADQAAASGAALGSPATFGLQLDVDALHVATAQGQDLDAGAKSIGLRLTNVVVPGFIAGAAPAATTEPLRAGATLDLSEPRAARGDGKEFAIAAKAISVPLTELLVPGSLAALSASGGGERRQPISLKLGEVRIEAPAIRVTRTKDGIVLPGGGPTAPAVAPVGGPPTPADARAAAAPQASPPTPGLPLAVQVAALRVSRGALDFADRAVQPAFSGRYAPIEIDARNVKYPDLTVGPLKIDLTSANRDGHVAISGEIGPAAGDLTIAVDDLALAPFNPYATTYSSYSIADGALTLKTAAKVRGGTYDVSNDVTLHQLDLAGAEGDSLFEERFGLSLGMALALLRDLQGNIELAVPLQVDEKGGARIDLFAVVQGALRQALLGAITSPLKMLGAIAGGKGAPIAPSPIAFRTGTAQPTADGAESVDRLAGFLAGRPAMAVELKAAATAADARWLHEQSLRAAWQDEGVFARSIAFLTQRGPRERIRAYLEARADDQPGELSSEDQATLDRWLADKPAPSGQQLRDLAAARLAAVEAVLRDKGVVAERMSASEPGGEPIEGKPAVAISFRPLGRPQPAASQP